MPPTQFPHLEISQTASGEAKLPGGRNESQTTKDNKRNRAQHSQELGQQFRNANDYWRRERQRRSTSGMPDLPEGVPLLLEIDTTLPLDSLFTTLGLEIVSEEGDGYIIVATESLDFTELNRKIRDFSQNVRGTGVVAKIHSLADGQGNQSRLQRILSDRVNAEWGNLLDDDHYLFDIGIETLGKVKYPAFKPRGENESDRRYQGRERRYQTKLNNLYEQIDQNRLVRESALEDFVEAYDGEIMHMIDDTVEESFMIADSFTARVNITGAGIKDFALNFPYVFEIDFPDDVEQNLGNYIDSDEVVNLNIESPEEENAKVCVIDSGIQEEHRYTQPAVDTNKSICYIPTTTQNDTADYVTPSGHGTRVAGAILYGEVIPKTGTHKLDIWVQNARVLDNNNGLPNTLFPPTLLADILEHFFDGEDHPTKIYNHSINSRRPYREKHMSIWAAAIDHLTYAKDILFILSSGNIPFDSNDPSQPGIRGHLAAGRNYPEYLFEPSSKIANPAQSFQALTVGSVTYDQVIENGIRSLSSRLYDSSGFTRTGMGLWGSIKPEVVELGGDVSISGTNPVLQHNHSAACPELIRSTRTGGSLYSRDDYGTSYSAPKVSRIVAKVANELPESSSLLRKAIVVQSARWPDWALDDIAVNGSQYLKQFGYGLPSADRAIGGDPFRITLVTQEDVEIFGKAAHAYQIPIPENLRAPENENEILIEVCLTYKAAPRRTRRSQRGYYSTWVDWKTSNFEESADSFLSRVFKDYSDLETEDTNSFNWAIGSRSDQGIRDVRRNSGATQKDWTIIKAHELPESFCIAVVGHEGWARRPQFPATYSLAVTFESLNSDIEIYEPIKIELDDLTTADLQV